MTRNFTPPGPSHLRHMTTDCEGLYEEPQIPQAFWDKPSEPSHDEQDHRAVTFLKWQFLLLDRKQPSYRGSSLDDFVAHYRLTFSWTGKVRYRLIDIQPCNSHVEESDGSDYEFEGSSMEYDDEEYESVVASSNSLGVLTFDGNDWPENWCWDPEGQAGIVYGEEINIVADFRPDESMADV